MIKGWSRLVTGGTTGVCWESSKSTRSGVGVDVDVPWDPKIIPESQKWLAGTSSHFFEIIY